MCHLLVRLEDRPHGKPGPEGKKREQMGEIKISIYRNFFFTLLIFQVPADARRFISLLSLCATSIAVAAAPVQLISTSLKPGVTEGPGEQETLGVGGPSPLKEHYGDGCWPYARRGFRGKRACRIKVNAAAAAAGPPSVCSKPPYENDYVQEFY